MKKRFKGLKESESYQTLKKSFSMDRNYEVQNVDGSSFNNNITNKTADKIYLKYLNMVVSEVYFWGRYDNAGVGFVRKGFQSAMARYLRSRQESMFGQMLSVLFPMSNDLLIYGRSPDGDSNLCIGSIDSREGDI